MEAALAEAAAAEAAVAEAAAAEAAVAEATAARHLSAPTPLSAALARDSARLLATASVVTTCRAPQRAAATEAAPVPAPNSRTVPAFH